MTVAGVLGLAAVVMLLPILGDESFAVSEQVAAYVLAVLPVGALVYGLLVLLPTSPHHACSAWRPSPGRRASRRPTSAAGRRAWRRARPSCP